MDRWSSPDTCVNRLDGRRVPVRRPVLPVRRVTCETPRVLSTAVTVLAHQGGWDEILMVLTPIAVFALLLKLANSRANKAQDRGRRATRPPRTTAADPTSSRSSAVATCPSRGSGRWLVEADTTGWSVDARASHRARPEGARGAAWRSSCWWSLLARPGAARGRRPCTARAAVPRVPKGNLVYDSNRTGNYEIFTMPPDGSTSTQLTDRPGVGLVVGQALARPHDDPLLPDPEGVHDGDYTKTSLWSMARRRLGAAAAAGRRGRRLGLPGPRRTSPPTGRRS